MHTLLFSTDEKQLLQLARQYNSEGVGNFVTSIGLSGYAKLFEDNGLSGDALMECTDEDLEDLGIESALSRLKIMILFRRQLHARPWFPCEELPNRQGGQFFGWTETTREGTV